MQLIIYQSNIIRIGGVETFTYNMCKNLSKYYDILLLYEQCHPDQLKRLTKYVECEKYNPKQLYKADLCLLASSWGTMPESVEAPEYWQMIHANYKELLKVNYKYKLWHKTTKHIAVSKAVKENFEEIYNIKCDVVYNLLDEIQPTVKPNKDKLRLLSATRLSGEKGYNRMVILADKLRERKIDFEWIIYTDLNTYNIKPMQYKEIVYKQPTYDIWQDVVNASYGVQLSDTEGYSYFVNECLQYGTPMIVTNFDSVYESVEDNVNGFILKMDLSNLDIDKIIKSNLKFKYTPKTTIQTWIDKIGNAELKDRSLENKIVEIQAILPYDDIQLKKHIEKGDCYKVNYPRAYEIISKGLAKRK